MKTSCNMLPSLVRARPLIFMTLRANTCRVLKRKLPSVIRLPLTASALKSNADTFPFLTDIKMALFLTARNRNSISPRQWNAEECDAGFFNVARLNERKTISTHRIFKWYSPSHKNVRCMNIYFLAFFPINNKHFVYQFLANYIFSNATVITT